MCKVAMKVENSYGWERKIKAKAGNVGASL